MQEKKDEKNVLEEEDSMRIGVDSIRRDIVNFPKDSLMEILPIQLTFLVDSNLIAEIVWDSLDEQTKKEAKQKRFFVQAKVGFSTYTMSLWDQSFEFGALSKRSFSATGININLMGGYEINAWLNPIVGFNYNAKQAKFNYSALYDDHGYLIYNIKGGLLPLSEINDNDFLCNSHLIENIEADISIQSFSLTLGNKFKLLQKGKIGIDLDLSYSLELGSGVVGSIQKIDVSNNLKDSFNSRINAGFNVNYQLSDQFKLFVDAEYIFMPNPKKVASFYQSDLHELIYSAGLRFNF